MCLEECRIITYQLNNTPLPLSRRIKTGISLTLIMNTEELRDYCLQKPHTEEGMPFGEDVLVFKVGGKIYLLMSLSQGTRFNVKCDPERAIELREQYTEVQPGYHMNKANWNTVFMDGNLTRKQLCEMIDHSYELILNSLPRKVKSALMG